MATVHIDRSYATIESINLITDALKQHEICVSTEPNDGKDWNYTLYPVTFSDSHVPREILSSRNTLVVYMDRLEESPFWPCTLTEAISKILARDFIKRQMKQRSS